MKHPKLAFRILILSLYAFIWGCQKDYKEPLVPLNNYHITEGFSVEAIASEPLLNAPVAMDFGSDGRIWVVQMPGFMNDIDGTGENDPSGSIRILEDLDQDGVADHVKIFLDSLVMPRALAHVYGGLLYAEPPNLWFVDIENDRPKNKVLVDSTYAPEGNPEHQPNGLLLHTDNWIYSANGDKRYQRKNGQWIMEPTASRGQWGITQDDFGRLFYNNNSTLLLSDYLLPHVLVRNQWFVPKKGLNQNIEKDQRVYPLHAASVNRGYSLGELNADSILVKTTAACGPEVYRGNHFPKGFNGNLFVCVPEGNLIKRILLKEENGIVQGTQAWENKEFLAATDEGFRPVSLENGLDGSLYVVDMHRGVIQHQAFLSPYLRERSKEKQLDTMVSQGRILRISALNTLREAVPNVEKASPKKLVSLLSDKNGSIRIKAQHQLVYQKQTDAVSMLRNLALNDDNHLAQIHALYTLEGLDALDFDLLLTVATQRNEYVSAHALALLSTWADPSKSDQTFNLYKELVERDHPVTNLYVAATLGPWAATDTQKWFPVLDAFLEKHGTDDLVQEAFLSGSQAITKEYALYVSDQAPNALPKLVSEKLSILVNNQDNNIRNPIYEEKLHRADARTVGAKLYRQLCAVCHGIDGKGTENLAPPLMGSLFVRNHEQLARIIFHGLTGPVHINGEDYAFEAAMPGFVGNQSLSDQDIKDIMAYVSNAFSKEFKGITVDRIKELRNQKSEIGAEYTEKELLELVED